MKRSIVVAASRGYEPGLRAFLNSYANYHPQSERLARVHVLDLELGAEFREGWTDFPWIENWIKLDWVQHGGQRNTAWSTKIPRFQYAADLEGVVMLCDADMFFCSNVDWWFDLAEQGWIVGGSNGSNVRYHQGWRDKYKLPLPDFYNYKTICSVPTVMRTDLHGQVWRDLYKHKTGGGEGADFDLQNIFMTLHEKQPHIVALPSQQTTGIHHFMLKLETGANRVDGRIVSRDGLEVYIVHGKWWQEGWRTNLLKKMDEYCSKFTWGTKCQQLAQHSWNVLMEEFERWQK